MSRVPVPSAVPLDPTAWVGRAVRLGGAVGAGVWLGGCGGPSVDSAAPAKSTDAAPDCGGSVDAIAPGLQVPCDGGGCTLEVVDTSPAPPDRGDNTWTLRVVDPAEAVAGLSVAPFMPAHDHGTVPADYAGTSAGDQTYTVGPFDLFMPGRWELRTTVQLSSGTTDSAVLAFCVEG